LAVQWTLVLALAGGHPRAGVGVGGGEDERLSDAAAAGADEQALT